MKLLLKKKIDNAATAAKEPIVVMMKEPSFLCAKVAVGEVLEVDEEMGYAIMGDKRFKGLFTQQSDAARPAAVKAKADDEETVVSDAKKRPPGKQVLAKNVVNKAIHGQSYQNKNLGGEEIG